MADTTGEQQKDLIARLMGKGHEFSLVQVVRLLRAAHGDSEQPVRIRVRPKLSLAFPAADVDEVEHLPGEAPAYRINVNFLGLYGVASPLPTFYTEDLMEEAADDRSANRDLLDIVHHRLYELYFLCWRKYQLFYRVKEEGDQEILTMLYSLIGVPEPSIQESLPDAFGLLRYAALFNHFPRSAWGLETLLRAELDGLPVRVIQSVRQTVPIMDHERMRLGCSGCTLGVDSVLGAETVDRMGKFRLQMGPMQKAEYESLLPGEPLHIRVARLVKFYLASQLDPLDYDLELIVAAGEIRTVVLGDPHSARLGMNSWCLGDTGHGERRVIFPLCDGKMSDQPATAV